MSTLPAFKKYIITNDAFLLTFKLEGIVFFS